VYVRTVKRRNKSGSVAYLQLAHNEWDPVKGQATPKVLFTFGRADELDRDAVKRLVGSLSRLLDPADALAATAAGEGLEFVSSRAFGGAHVLDHLWRELGMDTIISGLGQPKRGRHRDVSGIERVLFGLVANRALSPSSKLAATEWISGDVHIEGLPETTDDACYRAMDWLHEVNAELERHVFDRVATLLNLEVDLLFFDTTSTYFEIENADDPVTRDGKGFPATDSDATAASQDSSAGFRTWGRSKDSRDDLPQVVIGMAVTRDGIPVRCWCWPGNASDQVLIRQVKDDMRDWTLSKIVWVTDRGFSSQENRRYLRQGDHHYIIGEKMRSGSEEVRTAMSRQGRYLQVAENMRVKEVKVSQAERFVICHNPDAADRDRATRERLVAQLQELIAETDTLSDFKRGELRGKINGKPGLNRFLRVTAAGKLRVDAAKVNAEANFDGKYLLRCSDPRLSAEDIAVGYKQLLEVERGWRDMKSVLDLRPVYHRLEERIRAHVVLCWLALLLVRILETRTGSTWPEMRRELDRLHVGTFTGPTGTFRRLTTLTKAQIDLFSRTGTPAPKLIIELTPATA
jgi:hypothetical protein